MDKRCEPRVRLYGAKVGQRLTRLLLGPVLLGLLSLSLALTQSQQSEADEAQGRRLSAQEIIATLADKRVDNLPGVRQWTQRFYRDGTTVFLLGSAMPDWGDWHVRGETEDESLFCSRWANNDWVCYQVYLLDDEITWLAPNGYQRSGLLSR